MKASKLLYYFRTLRLGNLTGIKWTPPQQADERMAQDLMALQREAPTYFGTLSTMVMDPNATFVAQAIAFCIQKLHGSKVN